MCLLEVCRRDDAAFVDSFDELDERERTVGIDLLSANVTLFTMNRPFVIGWQMFEHCLVEILKRLVRCK
jgi:hypothetical protein